MKIAFSLVLLVVAVIGARATTPALLFDPTAAAKADAAFDRATYDRLQVLTVTVNWKEADIGAALKEVSDQLVKSNQGHPAIRFAVKIRPGTDPNSYHRHVSMVLTDVPVFVLIGYINNQTKMIPIIHKNEVVLSPGIETRYRMSPADASVHPGMWER
jgi:hypothetical protein